MNLAARDRAVIWHPFTQQKNRPDPIPVVKASGSLLYAENGQSYIDAISSWWVTLHGHAHPYIAERIYKQALELEQVIFAGFTHQPAVELAERILPQLPGNFSRVFYSDNGSTSTEVALKMAIQYWWNRQQPQRNKILAFRNAYHGDTFGAMSVSDRNVFTLAFHDLLFEVIFIDTPAGGNIQTLRATIADRGETIAAFIYEPLVQGAGGMKMYDANCMDELMKSVRDAGIICIADEVMTGFGRTGKRFASSYLQAAPDIICLSKGLTGGTMALGITACNDRIYEAYVTDNKFQTFFHGHSFTANPIACAAALASMDLLEKEDCQLRINLISECNQIFAEELKKNTAIKQVRQLGTILAFEVDQGKDEYLNNLSGQITTMALANGIYLRPLGNTVYLMPPYCITKDELQKIYAVIRLLLAQLKTE